MVLGLAACGTAGTDTDTDAALKIATNKPLKRWTTALSIRHAMTAYSRSSKITLTQPLLPIQEEDSANSIQLLKISLPTMMLSSLWLPVRGGITELAQENPDKYFIH
jgi:hypothetical protein